MPIQVAVFVVAVAVIVGGSYLYMRKQSAASVEEEADSEPDFPTIVAAAKAANPTLSFEPGRARSPEFFVVKERASGRQAQVPSGELAGAKIRFVDCDLTNVAPGLVYPNRTETTCLELRNDTPEYRLGLYKGRKEKLVTRTRRKEFTHEFIVSYMLWTGGGFVGYREEKVASH